MSFLEIGPPQGMGGFFESAAKGWGPFSFLTEKEERKGRKDLAKIRLREEAQTFEQKRVLAMDQQKAEALEAQREKTVNKLRQVELVATEATQVALQIREAAADPNLEGDPILRDLEENLMDMERAVVQIQANTVVDTATFDTYDLASAYSEAQSALVALQTIMARGNGILDALEERAAKVRIENERAAQAAAQREHELRVQVERERALQQQRQADLEFRQQEAERQRKFQIMQQAMQLDRELAKERRLLRQAKADLEEAKLQQAERAAQAEAAQRELAARRAALAVR